ncbi:hypothetical protein D3C72_1788760 [compost metagenome]
MTDMNYDSLVAVRKEKVLEVCGKYSKEVPEFFTRQDDRNLLMITFRNKIPTESESDNIDLDLKKIEDVTSVHMHPFRNIFLISWVIYFKE